MNSAIERLLSLRVKDVMNCQVVQISADTSMTDAARIFEESDITGAPVVDGIGKCVGVLSVTDFAYREHRLGAGAEELAAEFDQMVVKKTETESTSVEAAKQDRVGEHMSPVVQTVRSEASIMNAARLMCQEHIHRLVIVDDETRPVGVISALDLVACMVAAVEE